MRIAKIEDVDQFHVGLAPEKKQAWFSTYRRACSAGVAAGRSEADSHTAALQIADSRVDSLYDGTWPSPGKGAPRNPYGGFSSREFTDGSSGWIKAWKLHFSKVSDPKAFLSIQEWIWAVDTVLADVAKTPRVTVMPSSDSVSMREGELEQVAIPTAPSDYGLKEWKKPAEGTSLIDVAIPSSGDLSALYSAWVAERKRKELDGLLRADAAPASASIASQSRLDLEERMRGGLGLRGARDRQVRFSEEPASEVVAVQVIRHDEEAGILVADVPIMRLGVLPYRDDDGKTVFEAKLPQDFATAAFLSSVPGKPITDSHPGPLVALLREDERASLTKGFLHADPSLVRVDKGLVVTREIVFDEALIQGILDRKQVEVSTGIACKVIDEEGEYEGQKYQRRQTRPTLDHLAHVPRGRCGAVCAPVLDSDTATRNAGGENMGEKDPKDPAGAGKTPARVLKFDGLDIPLCPELKDEQVAGFQTKVDAALQARKDSDAKVATLTKDLETAKGRADGKESEANALATKVTALETAQKRTDEGFDGRLDERLEMVDFLRGIDPAYAHKGKTIAAMRVDALKLVDPEFKADGKTEEFILGRFDAAKAQLERAAKSPTGQNDLRGAPPVGDPKDAKARTDALWIDPNKPKQPAGK